MATAGKIRGHTLWHNDRVVIAEYSDEHTWIDQRRRNWKALWWQRRAEMTVLTYKGMEIVEGEMSGWESGGARPAVFAVFTPGTC